MLTIAEGNLLMNGTTVEWPPRDMNGKAIEIGAKVYGVQDTFNGQHEHEFTCGALRLQNTGGNLVWVVCAYEDDTSYYFECFAEFCEVTKAAPILK